MALAYSNAESNGLKEHSGLQSAAVDQKNSDLPDNDNGDTTDLFLGLTPDKVLEAVEAGGVRCNPVCYTLNSFENRVYEIELEDKSRLVSKFYRPGRWSREQILEEHRFLQDCEDSEIAVCNVRPFPDGTTLKTVDNIHYCLFDRKGGRAPEDLTVELVERLGMLVARMHIVGANRPFEHRITIDPATYIHKNLDWLDAHPQFLPTHLQDRFHTAALDLADIAESYLKDVPIHRVHGDLHSGNLIERHGAFHALDFDDAVIGPAVQDMWLLLPGRDTRTRRLREVFIEAYEQFRPFDRSQLRLIEPLRGMRYIHYAVWIARRWHDPAFPQTWPHFGTEDYWDSEVRDLEDLLRVVRDGDVLLQPEEPAAPTEELTNADFFWDMED
ncbi:MAG: Ser/Thr protein kinase RdoA (MazF antagonist) [Myxococcota bacterium]